MPRFDGGRCRLNEIMESTAAGQLTWAAPRGEPGLATARSPTLIFPRRTRAPGLQICKRATGSILTDGINRRSEMDGEVASEACSKLRRSTQHDSRTVQWWTAFCSAYTSGGSLHRRLLLQRKPAVWLLLRGHWTQPACWVSSSGSSTTEAYDSTRSKRRWTNACSCGLGP